MSNVEQLWDSVTIGRRRGVRCLIVQAASDMTHAAMALMERVPGCSYHNTRQAPELLLGDAAPLALVDEVHSAHNLVAFLRERQRVEASMTVLLVQRVDELPDLAAMILGQDKVLVASVG